MRNFTVDEILGVYQKKGYPIDKGDKRIMLTGIRSNDQTLNIFNDAMVWIQWENGIAKLKQAPITTDPGLYYLLHPCNPKGTAIVKPGLFPDCWAFGLHNGKYEALVQVGNITLIRDFNRDKVIDYNSGREETANNAGVNCHHAGEDSQTVDNWSAGCQVFKRLSDWYQFFADCKGSANKRFSYGLLLESDFEEQSKLKGAA
jgi:hypothetical protein